MRVNIADLIIARAREQAEHPAIIHDDRVWTYAELASRIEAVAERLQPTFAKECGDGVVPRVGLFCPNSPEYVAVALGILKAGGCLVPIAPELALPEREAQVRLTALHYALSAGPETWNGKPGNYEETGHAPWSSMRCDGKADFPEDRFAQLNPAFVRFSSGTTGTSKGAMISHETLLDRVRSANRRLRITPSDRVLWTLSMAHHFAVSIVLYLLHGATTVLEDSHLAAEVLSTARATGATVIYGSPFHHSLLAAEDSGRTWPTLRMAVSTAAALPGETAGAFRQRYGVPLTQGLGIIEGGLPLLNTDAAETKPLSVGRPDDIAVLLRREDGSDAAPGEIGEVCLQGPGLFDAYLAPWRERAEILQEGWFATGDLAVRDDDGHIYLRGKSKSVINVGGMKFFPEEVEAVLNAHPEICASRVIGEPHERFQTISIAQIVPRDLEHPPATVALARHCRDHLAGYKVPLRFQFLAELPRTASGKIKRG
jgi:long-chain acyl-CoA synthetase